MRSKRDSAEIDFLIPVQMYYIHSIRGVGAILDQNELLLIIQIIERNLLIKMSERNST